MTCQWLWVVKVKFDIGGSLVYPGPAPPEQTGQGLGTKLRSYVGGYCLQLSVEDL